MCINIDQRRSLIIPLSHSWPSSLPGMVSQWTWRLCFSDMLTVSITQPPPVSCLSVLGWQVYALPSSSLSPVPTYWSDKCMQRHYAVLSCLLSLSVGVTGMCRVIAQSPLLSCPSVLGWQLYAGSLPSPLLSPVPQGWGWQFMQGHYPVPSCLLSLRVGETVYARQGHVWLPCGAGIWASVLTHEQQVLWTTESSLSSYFLILNYSFLKTSYSYFIINTYSFSLLAVF